MRTSKVENDASEPRGWRHVVYAFGPWATGAALILFSVLIVAYENRYRSAVRHEIETRLKGKQEAAALVAAHRLRGYLGDVTSKLHLIAGLAATGWQNDAPSAAVVEIARHDTDRNYVAGIYIVDRDFTGAAPPRQVIAIDDDVLLTPAEAEDFTWRTAEEYGELVRQLRHYDDDLSATCCISNTLTLNMGRTGQVLSVPVREADGSIRGLVAALLPTSFEISQLERSGAEAGHNMWVLTSDGHMLGDWFGPPAEVEEVARVAAADCLNTVETSKRVLTVSPVFFFGSRPWTLVAAQPAHSFHGTVMSNVGGPWTRRLLLTVACGNFLGLVVLLTLRHWREQITVLRAQAEHDPLTNVYSRRFLDREAAVLCRRVSRLGLLMIDLNEFKRHNDTLGHYIGDQMLKAAAGVLTSAVRGEDFVVRLGGDEFLVLLPLADDEMVVTIEARIR